LSREIVTQALARVAQQGAHAADAVLIESDSMETRVRGSEVDFVTQARARTLGIRALVKSPEGLRSAVTSTSDLSSSAVQRMADETAALAAATAPDPHAGLPDGGFAESVPDLALIEPGDRATGVDARIALARRAESAARSSDERITNSEGSEASARFSRVVYANSEGFLGEYESAQHGLFSMPIARENGSMQTDYWMSASRTEAGLEAPERVGAEAARRALRKLGATQVPTAEVPVIFEPMTARSMLGHLVACVSGSAIYRKTSFLAGRLGETVASERVTVVDDGRRPGGLGSRPFDGEGLPTGRTTVIENGRLASYLLDTYSARKLGMASTGNAGRAAGGSPSASASNFWLEPGESSLQAMIAGVERGLLCTWLFGHGFNPVTGDFSRGAAGLWIENGKLSHPVDEITIAGNFGEMLAGIDAVGDDLLWLGGVASPSFRIGKLTVAGA